MPEMPSKRLSQDRLHALAVICIFLLITVTAGCTTSGDTSSEHTTQLPHETEHAKQQIVDAEFHDSHFHLTNYIQKGISIQDYLNIMGTRVGRSTLFGIPLQQTWSFEDSGNFAPTYYLHSDAPLYYYSFTDAFIAQSYLALTPEQQARFDPMITGFNPADMYAVDHIRRVLSTYPGVFSGIGEFSIHKEFVSAKVAGNNASLYNPSLDRILDFAGKVGLVVILHNDLDIPFAKMGDTPVHLTQLKNLFQRHPDTTIIWAHIGLGRVVHPARNPASARSAVRSPGYMKIAKQMLSDPDFSHVYFDISWDELTKYIIATPESVQFSADILNQYPDRFLFGTDNVAPADSASYFKVFEMYQPLWDKLTPEVSEKIRKGNYERIFDAANQKVRAWEQADVVR